MTTRHTITRADEVYLGDAFYGRYSPDGRAGVRLSHLLVQDLGAVVAGDSDGVAVAAALATTAMSATGALISGGLYTADVARSITFNGATGADLSAYSLTIVGTDAYGAAITETLAGSATSVATQKAFKTVLQVTATTTAATPTVNIGTATTAALTKYGAPVRMANKGAVLGVYVDGIPETTLTLVAALATTATPSATNADVRGTFAPNTIPDAAKRFVALWNVADHSTKDAVFGPTPA